MSLLHWLKLTNYDYHHEPGGDIVYDDCGINCIDIAKNDHEIPSHVHDIYGYAYNPLISMRTNPYFFGCGLPFTYSFWVFVAAKNDNSINNFSPIVLMSTKETVHDELFGLQITLVGSTRILLISLNDNHGQVLTINTNIPIQTNRYYHFCIVYDSIISEEYGPTPGGHYPIKIYINGERKGDRDVCYFNSSWNHPNTSGFYGIYFGELISSSNVFFCYYQDIRIYDHALSEKEVKEISRGLSYHFKMNELDELYECSGNGFATDIYYNQNNLSLQNNSDIHGARRYNNYISFISPAAIRAYNVITHFGLDNVYIGDNFRFKSVFSISLWILYEWKRNMTLFSFVDVENSPYTEIFKAIIDPATPTIGWTVNGTNVWYQGGVSSLSTYEWHHLCFVNERVDDYHDDTHIVFYVDGVRYDNIDSQFLTTVSNHHTWLLIGSGLAQSLQTCFEGGMSDFRIYRTALTLEDVTELYETGASIDNKGNLHCYEVNELTDLTLEMVDLGLPNGTLWAKCNLGAKYETDCGEYYQWASTTPLNVHWSEVDPPASASICPYYSKYDQTYYKYVENDQTDTLQIIDDAVSNKFPTYRIPSVEDFKELIDNTVNYWVSDYHSTGKSGWVFEGTNGNVLFFPAGGFCVDKDLEVIWDEGYYWTSNITTWISGNTISWNDNEALHFHFYDDEIDPIKETSAFRYCGMLIRPVL